MGPAHVDRHHQETARRKPLVHRRVGRAVLIVPRAAMQIEEHGKRAPGLRLVDPGHQGSGRIPSALDIPNFDLVSLRRVVDGCHDSPSCSIF
ncbi:MAG: hypothetical protein HYU47_05805 [Deltaproteobacteria bacterium]|nr:hypothetical protein [Deltaproteobacteria bacterium]